MEKSNAIILLKANPSIIAEDILSYQEQLLLAFLDGTYVSLSNIYRFTCEEINFELLEKSGVINKIRYSEIKHVFILSKTIFSLNPTITKDFEYFCNYHQVSFTEVSPLFQMINEISTFSKDCYYDL